jgi:hypothetical protein
MQYQVHKEETRGAANFGWLNAKHSFSFGSWQNNQRVHFGMLRVLNDDIVKAGFGFGKHPHDNMEIITIPLKGALEHKDDTGGQGVIQLGDVQVMSAGSGIQHSEFNHSKIEDVNLFQLWIFPDRKNVAPRYDQATFNLSDRENKFQTVVSPSGNEGLWIYQNAWISLANFTKPQTTQYTIKAANNGAYIMVVEGSITIGNETLHKRDAIGIWDTTAIDIELNKATQLLVIDVPMN